VLADGMAKGAAAREALIPVCERGVWIIGEQTPVCKRHRDD